MKRKASRGDYRIVAVETVIDILPDKLQMAMLKAIDFIKRYELPCDVGITELNSTTARHVWRKDGTCEILLSFALVVNGHAKAVHRRIIHEAAHHIAGFEHGHDEHFKAIASELYEREGYARGKPGDNCGNM